MELLANVNKDNSTYDVLLIAEGSDHRAYESLKILENNEMKIKYLFIFEFIERDNEDDLFQIPIDLQSTITVKTIRIKCSIKDPNSCLNDIITSGVEISNQNNIAIDISCFTKPYFFYLLKLLQGRFSLNIVNVFYTEPFSYYFPEKIFTSYKSSKGPLSILEIPGYSGKEQRGDKRLLIILLGFDGDLAKEICEDITPSEINLVNCFPGYIPKYKDISLIANEKLSSNPDNKILYSQADNPFEIYNLLTHIASSHKDYFINIAPLGTKPMALGACLFSLSNKNVRVVYPFPEKYNKVTTDRCWNTWQYKIPILQE